jgi:CRP-like cAMP-binding protein
MSDTIRATIENLSLFSGTSEGHLKRLTEAATLESFDAGVALIEEGGTTDNLFIVSEGSVRVWTDALGKEVELKTLSEGDYFGEVSLISGKAATANVAATDGGCSAVLIPRDTFIEVHDGDANVQKRLEGVTLARAKDTIGKVLQ